MKPGPARCGGGGDADRRVGCWGDVVAACRGHSGEQSLGQASARASRSQEVVKGNQEHEREHTPSGESLRKRADYLWVLVSCPLTWVWACGWSVPAVCCDTPSAAPPGPPHSLLGSCGQNPALDHEGHSPCTPTLPHSGPCAFFSTPQPY